ncbi:MAG TPA: Trm112 family protein [Terracidiphilus sp.]|jgi:uncharacterized protein YbaR (Trm112 family)
MDDKPADSSAFDPNVDPRTLAQLACPACYGELRHEPTSGNSGLLCLACGRAYPMVHGIPVLIIGRAARTGEKR